MYDDDEEQLFEELFIAAEDLAVEPEDVELCAEIRRRLDYGTSSRIVSDHELRQLQRIAGPRR